MNKIAIICGITVGLWGGIGWTVYAKKSATPADAPKSLIAEVQPTSGYVQTAGSQPVDIATLRAVLREELPAALASLKGNAQPNTPAAAPAPLPPATPELQAQRREALAAIEGMVAGGSWGNAERANFHVKLAMLDPDQAARALQEVIVAMNSGDINVHTDGPPL
jgi:hypothetical protein